MYYIRRYKMDKENAALALEDIAQSLSSNHNRYVCSNVRKQVESVQDGKKVDISDRFMVQPLISRLSEKFAYLSECVRDDGCWYIDIGYDPIETQFRLAIQDNCRRTQTDEKFVLLYDLLFGNKLNAHGTRLSEERK